MAKAAIYTNNNSTQTLAVGSTITPGSVIRRFGKNVDVKSDGINICGSGYYAVSSNFTLTVTDPGTIVITLYKDGTAITGATTSASLLADDVVTIGIDVLVREMGCPCNTNSLLTFVISGGAATVSNATIVVEKI